MIHVEEVAEKLHQWADMGGRTTQVSTAALRELAEHLVGSRPPPQPPRRWLMPTEVIISGNYHFTMRTSTIDAMTWDRAYGAGILAPRHRLPIKAQSHALVAQ
jgi:hypothetical protein